MEIKAILDAFKKISERLIKLESIGIPKDGKDGLPGKNGKDGINGQDGKDGKDFTFDMFTPEQIALLKGEKGKDGLPGKDGKNGINGKDGLPGAEGKQGAPGKDGKDGKPGAKGKNGKDGKDGRGIEDVYIDDNGHLIIVFTDGEKKDVGKVVGKDGVNGIGFAGAQGKPGQNGISVVDTKIDNKGHLIVTLSNGEEIDAGYVGNGSSGTGNVSSDTVSIIWTGTKEEYDALSEHSPKTLYFILQSNPEPQKPVYNKFRYNFGVKYNG